MTRHGGEPVEVLRRLDDPTHVLWRGQLHVVREILTHWAEIGEWWHATLARPVGVAVSGRAAPAAHLTLVQPPLPTWGVTEDTEIRLVPSPRAADGGGAGGGAAVGGGSDSGGVPTTSGPGGAAGAGAPPAGAGGTSVTSGTGAASEEGSVPGPGEAATFGASDVPAASGVGSASDPGAAAASVAPGTGGAGAPPAGPPSVLSTSEHALPDAPVLAGRLARAAVLAPGARDVWRAHGPDLPYGATPRRVSRDPDIEREIWRVRATAGRRGAASEFELCLNLATREWTLTDDGAHRRRMPRGG
jgi:hypothetical protein